MPTPPTTTEDRYNWYKQVFQCFMQDRLSFIDALVEQVKDDNGLVPLGFAEYFVTLGDIRRACESNSKATYSQHQRQLKMLELLPPSLHIKALHQMDNITVEHVQAVGKTALDDDIRMYLENVLLKLLRKGQTNEANMLLDTCELSWMSEVTCVRMMSKNPQLAGSWIGGTEVAATTKMFVQILMNDPCKGIQQSLQLMEQLVSRTDILNEMPAVFGVRDNLEHLFASVNSHHKKEVEPLLKRANKVVEGMKWLQTHVEKEAIHAELSDIPRPLGSLRKF